MNDLLYGKERKRRTRKRTGKIRKTGEFYSNDARKELNKEAGSGEGTTRGNDEM